MIGNKVQKMLEIVLRDRIILTVINYPAKKNQVNLQWAPLCEKKWNCLNWKKDSEKQNLGDYLAIPIYDYMTRRLGVNPQQRMEKTIHLYTIGSLVLLGHQDAVIWGSGILFHEPEGFIWKRNKYRKLDVRCVRGPETKRRLAENGYDVSKCVMGDPGVLMPLIYQPKEQEKRDYSVLLHMSVDKQVENQIDILTDDWQKTIDEIYNSKLIISSSLHGIILAEAYGIPAILLDELEAPDLFKYNDYYYSTGRMEYPICKSVEEALQMPIPKVPDLTQLQKNLLESFPLDLWKNRADGGVKD